MPVTSAAPLLRLRFRLALALAALIAAVTPALAAPEARPLAGQQVRLPQGAWSALPGARHLATFLMVSRKKGLTMLLKDSNPKLPEGSARSRRA